MSVISRSLAGMIETVVPNYKGLPHPCVIKTSKKKAAVGRFEWSFIIIVNSLSKGQSMKSAKDSQPGQARQSLDFTQKH
jgi:hypothetical protein